MNAQLNDKTNAYLAQAAANGYTPEQIAEAIKLLEAAKAAQAAKEAAKGGKKAKAEPTPEELHKAKVQKLLKDSAALEEVKLPTKTYRKDAEGKALNSKGEHINRQHGSGSINTLEVLAHAKANGYTSIAIHKPKTKGSKTDLLWGIMTFDHANDHFIYEGKKYATLKLAHGAFYPGAVFSNKSTIRSAYYLKDGETPAKRADRRLSEDLITYSPKATPKTSPKGTPEGSVAAAGGGEPAPEADDADAEHTCDDCGETYFGGDHICDDAPAPPPVAVPVASSVIIKGKAKVKKAAKA